MDNVLYEITPFLKTNNNAENMVVDEVDVEIVLDSTTFVQRCKMHFKAYPEPMYTITTKIDLTNWNVPITSSQKTRGKIIGQLTDLILMNSVFKYPENEYTCEWRVHKNTFLLGEENVVLDKVVFHIMNFSDLVSDKIIMTGDETFKSSVAYFIMEYESWVIRFHSVAHSHDLYETLNKQGGYELTHVGSIENLHGGKFKVIEVQEILSLLDTYFSFVRGIPCTTVFPVGTYEKDVVWKQASLPKYGWKLIKNWSSFQQLSIKQPIIEVYFPLFCKLLKDPRWAEVFSTVIDFYLYSSMVPVVKIDVVMLQVAFERLAYLFIVDIEQILLAQSYKKLQPETEKVRMFFRLVGVNIGIPDDIKQITDKLKLQYEDFVHLMYDVRNSTLHPVSKFPVSGEELEVKIAQHARVLFEAIIETLIGVRGLLNSIVEAEILHMNTVFQKIDEGNNRM